MGLIAVWPLAATADALDDANWARLHGCGHAVLQTALHASPALQHAALQMASSGTLHEALAGVGYFAARSSVLHLSGSVTDAQIRRALTANFCATLTNVKFREIGAAIHDRDVWLILAEPASVPAAADTPVVERRILDLVNAARSAGRRCGGKYFPAVPPLTLNSVLGAAALAHSRDMALHDEFEHRGHDGSTPETRVRSAGYGPFRIVGENIAAGAMSAVEVTRGWLASAPHCENIMDGRFTQIGIAFAANLRSSGGLYWTQDFAAPGRR